MNDRLKELRTILGIKQGPFAQKISTTQGHISDIENGRKELSDRTIKLICLEFNVSETWLRTGEGEIFVTFPPEDEYVKAAAELCKDPEDEIIRQAIIEYWKLNPEGKKYLREFMYSIAKSAKKEE